MTDTGETAHAEHLAQTRDRFRRAHEGRIARGDARADARPSVEHARLARTHPHEHDDRLLAAIRSREAHLGATA
jgi:hypothetical protein